MVLLSLDVTKRCTLSLWFDFWLRLGGLCDTVSMFLLNEIIKLNIEMQLM